MRDLTISLSERASSGSSPRFAWLRKNRGDFDREPQDHTRNIENIETGRGIELNI